MFDGAGAGDPMPWGVVLLLGGVLVLAGVVLVVGGRRSAKGTLPRNWVAGIRTPTTMVSDAAWDAAHRAAAGSLTLAGVVAVFGGLALFLRPSNGVGLAITTVVLVVMLGAVVVGARRGHRAVERL